MKTFLEIDRSKIGAWQAQMMFQCCRAFAHSLSPYCDMMARYVDHERVGWDFDLPTPEMAASLLAYHQHLMGRL
jgi:hypothetical protein